MALETLTFDFDETFFLLGTDFNVASDASFSNSPVQLAPSDSLNAATKKVDDDDEFEDDEDEDEEDEDDDDELEDDDDEELEDDEEDEDDDEEDEYDDDEDEEEDDDDVDELKVDRWR